jgi:hypothetical protein
MTDREKQFLSELANVLERHGLTIERHTFHDSNYHAEDWAFTGEDFDLDISDAVEELERRRGNDDE